VSSSIGLTCFIIALSRETRKHQTVVHRWRVPVTPQHSAPRYLAPLIELKHDTLHGSDEDELRQVAGPTRAIR
jgi:hypothetical protein